MDPIEKLMRKFRALIPSWHLTSLDLKIEEYWEAAFIFYIQDDRARAQKWVEKAQAAEKARDKYAQDHGLASLFVGIE